MTPTAGLRRSAHPSSFSPMRTHGPQPWLRSTTRRAWVIASSVRVAEVSSGQLQDSVGDGSTFVVEEIFLGRRQRPCVRGATDDEDGHDGRCRGDCQHRPPGAVQLRDSRGRRAALEREPDGCGGKQAQQDVARDSGAVDLVTAQRTETGAGDRLVEPQRSDDDPGVGEHQPENRDGDGHQPARRRDEEEQGQRHLVTTGVRGAAASAGRRAGTRSASKASRVARWSRNLATPLVMSTAPSVSSTTIAAAGGQVMGESYGRLIAARSAEATARDPECQQPVPVMVVRSLRCRRCPRSPR